MTVDPAHPQRDHADSEVMGDQARSRLLALVEEGLASGPATPMTEAEWDELDAIAAGKTS